MLDGLKVGIKKQKGREHKGRCISGADRVVRWAQIFSSKAAGGRSDERVDHC